MVARIQYAWGRVVCAQCTHELSLGALNGYGLIGEISTLLSS